MVQQPLISKPRQTLATGDRSAPPGSEDWAIAIRLDILIGLRESSSSAEHLERLVSAFREHRAWQHLPGPNGSPFHSWESFCTTSAADGGLGYDSKAIDAIVNERRNAQVRAQSPEVLYPYKTKGRGQKRDSATTSLRGADYLIARLNRDEPEHLAKLQRGEYKSVRKAALAARIVKPRVSVERSVRGFARSAQKHLSIDERRELIRLLCVKGES